MALPEVVADALAGVRIFAGLDAADLAELADGSARVPVRAGDFLFHEGDHGDALFVVLSGRLEALAGTPPRVLRVLARDDAIGELALLTDSPRSASVRARRDSELLRVDAAAVARLLADEPAFAAAVTRSLAEQLRASQALDVERSPTPATVAVVALPGAGGGGGAGGGPDRPDRRVSPSPARRPVTRTTTRRCSTGPSARTARSSWPPTPATASGWTSACARPTAR